MADLASNVTNDEVQHRFELSVDGHVAFAEYFIRGNVVTFTHTLVPNELEGKGVGSALAKAALNDARSRGLAVIPRCPFIHAYIERHPEYLDILDASFEM
jgi:predicted GNAT family acetyltransferase